MARQENLQEFLSSTEAFVDERTEEGNDAHVALPDFLQEISLLTDLESKDDEASRVSLMTIHAAKGLEFPTVFVVGMEENIFPSPMCTDSLRELEEERRLLYVAITRAERHCILTFAKNRLRYGKMEMNPVSRFIKDIDPRLMEFEGAGSGGYRPNRSYGSTFGLGDDFRQGSGRMQNSNPVASQFRADPKPKITTPRRSEVAIDPLSPSFKQRLAVQGGNLKKVNDAIAHGGRTIAPTPSSQPLHEGSIIEHQRFGVGTVTKLEGSGDETKATVSFQNVGVKQLLLKFARYTIIS